MSNRFSPPLGLPFGSDDENSHFAQEFAHRDLVESDTSTDSRLHTDDLVDARHEHYLSGARDTADVDLGSIHHVDVGSRHYVDRDHGSDDGTQIDADATKLQRAILERDRLEREATRVLRQRDPNDRQRRGSPLRQFSSGRRTADRPRNVGDRNEPTDIPVTAVRRDVDHPHFDSNDWSAPDVPVRNQRTSSTSRRRLATDASTVRRILAGPLNGTALAMYFLLSPYVVISRWTRAPHTSHPAALRGLLLLLAGLWLIFFIQITRNILRARRGQSVSLGASGWLAGMVITVLPILGATTTSVHPATTQLTMSASAPRLHHTDSGDITRPHLRSAPTPLSAGAFGAVPLALVAKRRRDLLRERTFDQSSEDVDATIELLRAHRPDILAHIGQLIGPRTCGVLDVVDLDDYGPHDHPVPPFLVCYLGTSATGSTIGFAREGGRLPIGAQWDDNDIRASIIALHEGKIEYCDTQLTLVRSLATRSIHHSIVVYLGDPNELDSELSSCCVTLAPFVSNLEYSKSAEAAPMSATAFPIRIHLLRADPSVSGLVEPFTPTLRRRSLEMLSYLALHRHEPITGDRLRSRVLTHADVDASQRTLANTASAVRRSIGTDGLGPRLHAVTSAGLYVTHGVSSDVEMFSNLISRARKLSTAAAAPLAREALALIQGEPLASALRGYEWFLAEGFGARLSRDGEWAALLLHHDAVQRDQFELAFWSLQQGLLIDPFSEVLLDAMVRVPRLREFGGNRPDIAQDQPIGPSRAVAMSWSLNGFRNQITQ